MPNQATNLITWRQSRPRLIGPTIVVMAVGDLNEVAELNNVLVDQLGRSGAIAQLAEKIDARVSELFAALGVRFPCESETQRNVDR